MTQEPAEFAIIIRCLSIRIMPFDDIGGMNITEEGRIEHDFGTSQKAPGEHWS